MVMVVTLLFASTDVEFAAIQKDRIANNNEDFSNVMCLSAFVMCSLRKSKIVVPESLKLLLMQAT